MAKFDTSRCMFDPEKFGSSVKIQSVYPETEYYTEFTKNHHNDIKVAILLSDDESPFLSIKDNRMKMIAIYDYLDMDRTTKKGKEKFDQIEGFHYGPIFDICAIYIEMQNNHDFSAWWALNRTFYDLSKVMSKPLREGEDETKYVTRKLSIQKQLDQIQEAMSGKEMALFGNSKMKMAVARSKMKRMRTYAEMHAMSNTVQ